LKKRKAYLRSTVVGSGVKKRRKGKVRKKVRKELTTDMSLRLKGDENFHPQGKKGRRGFKRSANRILHVVKEGRGQKESKDHVI